MSRLVAYLDSIKARDPAPRSRWEILLYPGVLALGLHRTGLFTGRPEFLITPAVGQAILKWCNLSNPSVQPQTPYNHVPSVSA